MSPDFRIDFDWLARESGNVIERATLAELSITVNQQVATRIEDLLAKSVRSKARLSAFNLASWLASNWWRLRWEPQGSDFSWKMSHKMGAAGGGYLWPDLTIISDGDTVMINVQKVQRSAIQPICYLEDFDESVPADTFEQGVDDFLDAVLTRLSSEHLNASDLDDIWSEIREERQSPERTVWRKLEAILGYNPDEAPDGLIDKLLNLASNFGTSAIEEIAAAYAEEAPYHLDHLWNEVRPKAVAARVADAEGIRQAIQQQTSDLFIPWQRASCAARIARQAWKIKPGPVSTPVLSDCLQISEMSLLSEESPHDAKFSAGFRNGGSEELSVFLQKRHPTGRRFALARLVGGHLEAPPTERLLAATDAKTAKQKFQRAFAQEFLCPFDDLIDYLSIDCSSTDEPSDDEVELGANHFDVSPLVVKTILVNKHLMQRKVLVT